MVELALPLRVLFAVLLGAVQSQAYAHVELWPLQLIAVGGLAVLALGTTPWRAGLLGLSFGTAWLCAGIWWLYNSLHVYGGLPAWMAVAPNVLLSVFLSVYLALAMAAYAWLRTPQRWRNALNFGALWLLAELARGIVFTGFPWISSGYAHVQSPLAGLAPWVGVYGMGAVAAVLAAWPASVGATSGAQRALSLTVPVAVLAALAGAGTADFTQATRSLTVSLLQNNVAQDEKFDRASMPQAMAWTLERMLDAPGELVVGPETVIPLLPSELDPQYWQDLKNHFQHGDRSALFGLPLGDETIGYTNSVAGMSAAATSLPGGFYRYDKHHLVPFGEFIPRGFRWFTQLMNIPLGDFNRGPEGAASFVVKGERIGPNICFEDLFGEELAVRFSRQRPGPTIFANVSNIGWFGDTVAIDQHLQISRMRTLEFQRPMIRATNTGATVVIDHRGRITAAVPHATRIVLNSSVEGRTGMTPYVWWVSRFGLWPLVIGALTLLAYTGSAVASRRH